MARQRRGLASIRFATAYQREEAQGHRIALSRSATAKTRVDRKAKARQGDARKCHAKAKRGHNGNCKGEALFRTATAKERKADTSNGNALFCGGIAQT